MPRGKKAGRCEENKVHNSKISKMNKDKYDIQKQRKSISEYGREGTWCCGG